MSSGRHFLFKPHCGDHLVENKIDKRPERRRCDSFYPNENMSSLPGLVQF